MINMTVFIFLHDFACAAKVRTLCKVLRGHMPKSEPFGGHAQKFEPLAGPVGSVRKSTNLSKISTDCSEKREPFNGIC